MGKNAVIPYALIAGIGILLVIVVSFVGLNQQKAIQEEENGGEQSEQQEGDSGGGESGGESDGGETAANGEEVFQNNCAQCHGQDLSGGAGPALDAVGGKYSKDEIKQIIADGFPDAGMPPGLIQGEDADAVAQWLSEQK
ncbi:c-type cytochrome [Lentibacillus salicampi]|uniref:Cytochrome c n=1 Tax=Lentibacillus salicampi TaxID=175306 RepID=A0A4Y9AI57_9BACI|nr:cytochrome c [Lentibacillus salicampi]TFJ94094.1 cytochrome c [Lentibacillus salicampi]